MKTIEKAASIYAEPIATYTYYNGMDNLTYCDLEKCMVDSFKAGADFAQQFINIEDEKPEYYEPVIIELQNGGVIAWRGWSEIYGDTYTINGTDIYLMAKEVKRWRPINFK